MQLKVSLLRCEQIAKTVRIIWIIVVGKLKIYSICKKRLYKAFLDFHKQRKEKPYLQLK